jgi:hypothetical protein
VKAEMTKIINSFHESWNSTLSIPSDHPPTPALDEKTLIPAQVYLNEHNFTGPTKVDGALECPSPYLQSHCTLCFGGRHAADLQATVIVCIDANFQLKCNHDKDQRKGFEGQTGAWDPEIFSPRTVELLQADLDDMAARINEV